MGAPMKVFLPLLLTLTIFQIFVEGLYVEERKIVEFCRKCGPGWGVVRKCSRYKDTECRKCKEGYEYSPNYSFTNPCYLCSRCGVGLFEAQKCTRDSDTICDACTAYIGNENFTMKNDFYQKCSYIFLKK